MTIRAMFMSVNEHYGSNVQSASFKYRKRTFNQYLYTILQPNDCLNIPRSRVQSAHTYLV